MIAFPLAAVAGFVDAAAYIALGHLFVSHVTGDANRIGQRLGRGDLAAVVPALAVEAALVAGLIAAAHAGFYAVLGLAVAAMGVQTAAVVRQGPRTVRTTYMSGMSTRLGQQLANLLVPRARHGEPSFLRDELELGSRATSLRDAAFFFVLLGCFVGGATAGALALVRLGATAFAIPLTALVAACVFEGVFHPRGSR